MKSTALSCVVATALALAASTALAQDKRTVLNLETAKKMAAACEQKAKAEGWKMNIAIVDTGGNLKYFLRQDDAFLGSVKIAQLKAGTSSNFPFSTKQIGEIAKNVPGIAFVPGLVTFEGGLPIKTASGESVGAIGVSGDTAEHDGVCAQAGVDAVKDDLK
ncbi:MAG TPA: heme-binding protein [Burkholderiales bacterium]|nr:heme-binding protein [Burkholderiales bacterium]